MHRPGRDSGPPWFDLFGVDAPVGHAMRRVSPSAAQPGRTGGCGRRSPRWARPDASCGPCRSRFCGGQLRVVPAMGSRPASTKSARHAAEGWCQGNASGTDRLMWCSAMHPSRQSPLGATYGSTPHDAPGSRTRQSATRSVSSSGSGGWSTSPGSVKRRLCRCESVAQGVCGARSDITHPAIASGLPYVPIRPRCPTRPIPS
jgi:hypothetical protein